MHERDTDDVVVQAEPKECDRQRDREDRDREHLRREHDELETLSAAEGEARERVPGRRAEHEAKHDRDHRDADAVEDGRHDAGRLQERLHRLGAEVRRQQRLGIDEDVVRAAERGEEDQVEGNDHPQREQDRAAVDERPVPGPRVQRFTSASRSPRTRR